MLFVQTVLDGKNFESMRILGKMSRGARKASRTIWHP